MQSITNKVELKNAIQLLEVEQAFNGDLLKEQFLLTYESFKPINLLKSTLKDIVKSPDLIENVLGGALGLASGYLSKKIVVGASGNIFRKLLGSIIQLGVTNAVSQHPDAIKSFGQFILQQIFHRKEHATSQERSE